MSRPYYWPMLTVFLRHVTPLNLKCTPQLPSWWWMTQLLTFGLFFSTRWTPTILFARQMADRSNWISMSISIRATKTHRFIDSNHFMSERIRHRRLQVRNVRIDRCDYAVGRSSATLLKDVRQHWCAYRMPREKKTLKKTLEIQSIR